MLFLLLLPHAYACDTAYPNAELSRRVDAALVLYEAFEVPDFRTAAAALEGAITCASEPVPASLAARVHMVMGILSWNESARDRAAQAWAAARRADPSYSPSDALFPADSAERGLWDGIGTAPGAERPLPPSRWWVDGREARTVGTERPALVQELDRDGVPVRSAYAWPDASWPPAPAPKARWAPLLTGAGSLAAIGVGAGLFVSAYVQYDGGEYRGVDTGTPEFDDWYHHEFLPSWYGGITLMGVGGAGLAASAAWLVVTPHGVAVHGTF